MIDLQSLFPNSINPDSISVYLGRVISLDDNFQDNGYLYVDLVNPNSTDLVQGEKTSNRAQASFALRNLYNCWERPPEIKSKTNFMGSMSMTTSGDFHLRNYCFDVQTLTWFTTVSTALNAIGIVNIPPVMVSLDTTPLPGQAVSVNISQAAKEVVEEAIEESIRNLTPKSSNSSSNSRKRSIFGGSKTRPNLQTVKQKLSQLNNTSRSSLFLRNSRSEDVNDVIAKIIKEITDPIESILNKVFQPYYQFINCINLLFQIYDKQLDAIDEITWPITTLSNIETAVTKDQENDIATKLAIKNKLRDKIQQFKNSIPKDPRELIPVNMTSVVTEALYEPLNFMYQTVSNTIDDIVSPIKNKIKNIIVTYIKEPLSNLTSYISLAIQPAVSSLPTIVQVAVKLALKKLLKVILGQPIKYILNKVVSPIENLLDSAAKEMKDKVTEVFGDAVNAIIKPLINPIQTAVTEMLPTFSMDSIEEKLTEVLNGVSEFPDIYIGIDPLRPYKKFVDINWSDSNEVSCMLHTLIQETGIPSSWTPSVVELTKIVDSISFQEEAGGGDPNPPQQDPEDRDPPSVEPEPTPTDTTYVLKKFDSKEDFIPMFVKQHPPVMIDAKLGEGMFEKYGYGDGKIKPSTWITNGVDYVTTDTGEKYVVSMNDRSDILVLYPESQEVGIVNLEKDYVYESEEIPHLVSDVDRDTPTNGSDLVPKVHLYIGSITPNKLQIQKMNDKGELLYHTNLEPPEKEEDTYDNIVQQYLLDKTEVKSLSDYLNSPIPNSSKSYVQDLLDRINSITPDPYLYPVQVKQAVMGDGQSIPPSPLYSLLTTRDNYNKKPEGIVITRNTVEEGVLTSKSIPQGIFFLPFELFVSPTLSPSDNEIVLHIYNSSAFDPIDGEFPSDHTSVPNTYYFNSIYYKIVLTKQSDNKFGDFQFIPQMEYYYIENRGSQEVPDMWVNYRWLTSEDTYENIPNPLFATSYTLQTKDPDSLYIRVKQNTEKTGEKVLAEELSSPDKTEKGLLKMFLDAVYAFGQDTIFDSSVFLESEKRKVVSVFSPLADSVQGVQSAINSALETVEALKEVDDMIGTIQEVGTKVQEIVDTAKPALEATATAASSAALLQSCSMTQAAKGKDFTFTSGSDYDLSTTTDSRLQLPYCKELNREHFLEPNCKVLVLAVGAGKQNLYVVDILS